MQAGGYGHHAVADLYCVSMTAFWGLESCQKCHRIGKSLVADMPLQINPLSICFFGIQSYSHLLECGRRQACLKRTLFIGYEAYNLQEMIAKSELCPQPFASKFGTIMNILFIIELI